MVVDNPISDFVSSAKWEKSELQSLNSRLESFISEVQTLELQNKNLINDLEHLKSSTLSSLVQNRSFQEVSEARNALYAVQVDEKLSSLKCQQLHEDLNEYGSRRSEINQFMEKEKKNWTGAVSQAERALQQAKNEFNSVLSQEAALVSEQEHLLEDFTKANDALFSSLTELEKAKLNEKRLRDELEFIRSVNNSEIYEIQRLLTQAPTDTRVYFESSLADAIREIKVQYDIILEQSSIQLRSRYDRSVSSLRNHVPDDEEARRLETIIRQSEERCRHLEEENRLLEANLYDHRRDLELDDVEFQKAIELRDERLRFMYEDYETLKAEIEVLISTRSTLDAEISIYAKLLDTYRTGRQEIVYPINNVQIVDEESQDAGERVIRTRFTRSGRGNICIEDADVEGKVVVLKSLKKTQDISGFQLERIVDNKRILVYTIPPRTIINGEEKISLHASNEYDVKEVSGNNIVVEEVPSWGAGNKVITHLYDTSGKRKATFTLDIIEIIDKY